MWIATKDKTIAIFLLEKNGSTSIREAVQNMHTDINIRELLNIPVRITWVRNPIDRLVSAYSFFNDLWRTGQIYTEVDYSRFRSWNGFVDFVLSGGRDSHWDSQSAQLMHKEKLIPTVCYPFENFEQTWSKHFSCQLPHRNKSHKKTVDSYRADELKEFYLDDYKLRESLQWR